MLEIMSGNKLIILREFIETDIEDYILWNTTEIEWMNWDAPWEKRDSVDAIKEREHWTNYYNNYQLKPNDRIRIRLEICINNKQKTHIGWINYYDIDQYFKYTKDDGNCTIGIGIPEQKYRKNGYGSSAIYTYVDYLKSKGIKTIYTQTWSGNLPMISLANKLGFIECNRFKDLREVNGRKYDALTFVLRLYKE